MRYRGYYLQISGRFDTLYGEVWYGPFGERFEDTSWAGMKAIFEAQVDMRIAAGQIEDRTEQEPT